MKSFAFRVTCRFSVLVTATTAAVLVVAGFLLHREMEQGFELLHDIEAHELAELLGPDRNLTTEAIAHRIKHDADSDAALFVIQVADAQGNVQFRSGNLGETLLPAGRESDEHATITVPFLGPVYLSSYFVGPWRIQIGSPLAPSERLLRDYARMCVPLLIGVALASIGLGYAFSRATLRPIRAIQATANRIRADSLTERIPVPPGHDELAALTQLLNQMFDRLQASFEQVHRFAADASHELKTPLALIRLNVEKLRSRLAADGEDASATGDVLEEIARLHQVIDRLLFLAKAESGALPLALRPLEMVAFVDSFAEDARALAEDRGVRFVIGTSERGEIKADEGLLRQLLLNLVANAVAVSPPGGLVQLDSMPAGRGWCLVVTDEGPGVPVAELPRIYERFVQVSGSGGRVGGSAGHGLGLAICKSIVELHGGTIVAENRGDRSGLCVTVKLPA